MSVHLLSLLVFSGLTILTACGGGGGGSNTPPAPNNPAVPANPANPVVPVVPAPPVAQIPLGISLISGTGAGSGNLDGVGAQAHFGSALGLGGPAMGGVGVGRDGALYVADTGNLTIRRVSQSGAVTTLAGFPGSSGSTDGVGTSARFSRPTDLAVTTDGLIYVVDDGKLRRITTEGVVSTVTVPAEIQAISRGLSGSLYLATSTALYLQQPDASQQLIAGMEGVGDTRDGSKQNARFANSYGGRIAADSKGNLYVAENSSVRKVTPAGVASLFVGSRQEVGMQDGSGATARFSSASRVAVDAKDNVWVIEQNNSSVGVFRKITPEGVVSTPYDRIKAQPELFTFDQSDKLYFTGLSGVFTLDQAGATTSVAGSIEPAFQDAPYLAVDQQGASFTFERSLPPGLSWRLNKVDSDGGKLNIGSQESIEIKNISFRYGGAGVDSKNTFYASAPSISGVGFGFGAVAKGGAIYQVNQKGEVSTLLSWADDSPGAMAPGPMSVTRDSTIYFIDLVSGNLVSWTKSAGLKIIANIPGAKIAAEPYPFSSLVVGRDNTIYALRSNIGAFSPIIFRVTGGRVEQLNYSPDKAILERFHGSLAADSQGNVYLGSGEIIQKISPAGDTTIVAGQLNSKGLRTGALPGSLNAIRSMTTDDNGILYLQSKAALLKVRFP